MKRTRLFLISLLILSTGYVGYAVYNDVQSSNLGDLYLSDVEALARNEGGGANITCHCKYGIPNNCAADNTGATCASGENIMCSKYAGNCSGGR